ncbi:ABC transporter permease [Canibacter sp. lx-72]|uniref:ABC transporter permease n=1 Tax=Canibacter zhuwentaonis TaxID=2837491 RepID=UPI001BDC78DE|nr:ABC transporter permease [Canibacter zhuwentaonis]MBT1018434.1 ABC transporter permease [Canibacter zhuwentaonis]MBT1035623.1 ABC transporter permease [Canibacter zhuwentaonis]
MLKYILFRLLQVIPVVIGTTLLIYFLVFAMPGDPIIALFGEKTPSPEIVAKLRAEYNLDKPFIVQYLLFMGNVLQGDLGTSFSGEAVSSILARTFPVTIMLAIIATTIELLLAITLGLFSGLRKGKWFDNINLIVGLILMSIPIFVVAFLMQYVLSIEWRLFPTTVAGNVSLHSLLLPGLVLGISAYPVSMRLTRASTIDTLNQDFVRTAYSKGLSHSRVIPVHVLRNSLIPTVTNSAASFGTLIVGATVTEGIFNVPGVGNTLYQAIIRGENATVVSFVTVMVLMYLGVNLLVDLLYALLDPRIRYA